MADKTKSENGLSSNWREIIAARKKVEEVILPSGLIVHSRKPDLTEWIMSGRVPQTLIAQFERDNATKFSMADFAKHGDDFSRMMDTILMASVTYPPLKEGESDEDHLGLADIPTSDKLAFFGWTSQGVEALRPFPEQQNGGAPS